MVAAEILERRLRDAGRSDLVETGPWLVVGFVVALLGSTSVGGVLAWRRPFHLAGWLFLALALSLALSVFMEAYGAYGAIYDPGSLPGARLAAVYADGSFLPWICILALILLVTPTGSAPTPRWKAVGWVAAGSCVVFLVAITFRSRAIDSSPFEGMTGPFANNPLAESANVVAFAMVVTGHLSLLAAIVSLVHRARRARGDERRQLLWLLVPAVPFPFLVVGAWWASRAGNEEVLGVLAGAYLATVPVAAALAIEKQRLYDIDRIISRTVAYTALSVLVVSSYIGLVVLAGIAGGRTFAQSVPAAVIATLGAVLIGGVARRKLQDTVDRRFNRRAFDAIGQVRQFVRTPAADLTIEQVLADASGDPSLRVVYWNELREAWVSEDGMSGAEPPASAILVPARQGGNGAAISFDETAIGAQLLSTLAAAARPELENARLRAAIQLQLAEVRDSRARIVTAQLTERKRIERDLHDGSQQRLLALAMNLRATELAGDSEAAMRALPAAINEIQATIRELRELAAGLYPGVLEDGGLSVALRELAARAPIPVHLNVLEQRLAPSVESSAWFIACEAVTNVVKHARASGVTLAAAIESGSLVLSIDDDGVGGADSHGHGLRGIADRAEAAGGSVLISDRPGGGTSVRAVLPCE